MRRFILLSAFLIFALFPAVQAAGGLLQANDPTISGYTEDGWNLTYDTITGFSWLDVTITEGLSYEDVSPELAAGGIYQDFRYATEAEILELWLHAGFGPHDQEPALPEVIALVDLFGATYHARYGARFALGIYEDFGVPDLV